MYEQQSFRELPKPVAGDRIRRLVFFSLGSNRAMRAWTDLPAKVLIRYSSKWVPLDKSQDTGRYS